MRTRVTSILLCATSGFSVSLWFVETRDTTTTSVTENTEVAQRKPSKTLLLAN